MVWAAKEWAMAAPRVACRLAVASLWAAPDQESECSTELYSES
jgi:hypothetical protein